ncbi:MAG: peptidase, partial [Polaromonas sp.]
MKSTALNNTRLIVALLTAGAIGGAGVGAFNAVHSAATAAMAPPAIVAGSGAPSPALTTTPMALPDFSQITERYGPSVVNISVT